MEGPPEMNAIRRALGAFALMPAGAGAPHVVVVQAADLAVVKPVASCAADGGFVMAATDMGHQGQDAGLGLDPQRRADFAYRAQHATAP